MPHSIDPDRIRVACDDRHVVANAGLLWPITLARRLELKEAVEKHLCLGDTAGRANVGDKYMTLAASALIGGDCINDAAVLGSGDTAKVLSFRVKAPSTLGTFLRGHNWGNVRQLDRVSRILLRRAWDADAGAGDRPLTIDIDSTVCQTYGAAQGRRPPPRLQRPTRLPPAAGGGRRVGRGALRPPALWIRQHRPGRRPFPDRDDLEGALGRRLRADNGAGRLRVLFP